MREALLDGPNRRRQDGRGRDHDRQRRDEPRDGHAGAPALEAQDRLEPLLVIVTGVSFGVVPSRRREARCRRRRNQQRERGPLSPRGPRISRNALLSHAPLLPGTRCRHDGKAVCSQREVHLGSPAPILGTIPVIRGLTATPVHDDLELVVRTERCPEGRDEVATAEPIASDDAQALGLVSHRISSRSNADAERGSGRPRSVRLVERRKLASGQTLMALRRCWAAPSDAERR